MTETFQSPMPTPDEIDELELPADEPVMALERTTRTADDTPIEFVRGVHAASRFAWSYTFEIPE
jgi:GntR family transcriptional regulator